MSAYFDEYLSAHVTIVHTRWQVYIKIDRENESSPREFVASADAGFTNHDGIWFGTRAEFDEELTRL